jgi:DNA repair photolyase
MRWDALPLLAGDPDPPPQATRPRIERQAVVRRQGDLTFYEVQARRIIERLPAASPLPQRFAVNPYRGCANACRHCSGRRGHRYLGLDAGRDFESKIVVRANVARRLRAELAAPGWHGEEIVLGVAGDCYQLAEDHYRLMPGVLSALAEQANPFTVLTKSPLVLRDADLLADAARACPAQVAISVAFVDERVRRTVEPGAPSPQKRLELCADLGDRGVACGVLMSPILPCLTDSPDQLAATVRRIAQAGARSLTPVVLRLPPGTREWYLAWLAEQHPALLPRYQELYAGGVEADPAYRARVTAQVRELAELYGIGRSPSGAHARHPELGQLTLL